MRHLLISIVLIATITLGVSGCRDEDDSTIENVTIDFDIRDKFGSSARSFASGEEVRFVFVVTNHSTSRQTLSYTAPAWSLNVRRVEDGQIVWNPHHGLVFPQVISTVDIDAGEKLTFVAIWDMQPTPGLADSIPAGDYDAEPGFFMFSDDSSGELRLDVGDRIVFAIQ